MKHIKLLLAALTLACSLGMVAVPLAASAAPAASTPKSDVCNALGSGNDCTTKNSNSVDLNSIVKVIINVLSIVVGIVAVVMIIIGGLKYITSSGDSNNITSAKNTILYAIIGLVIVALAQFIVQFVLNKATGGKKTGFVTSHVQQFGSADNRYYVLN